MGLYREFSFVYPDAENRLEIPQMAEAFRLPALALSLARLRELNQPVGNGGERAYFFDLLQNRSFSCISPETGNVIESASSVVLRDRTILFGFPAEPAIAVAASHLGHGFPLSAIIHFHRHAAISIGDKIWDFHPRHMEFLCGITTNWMPTKVTEPGITFVLGHPNFAHCAQNQLPAISQLIGHGAVRDASLVTTHQPLGPVCSLYPEHDWRETPVPESELERLNRAGALFVPLGSTRVTKDLADRVLTYAGSRLGLEASRIVRDIADARPRLWVSVRTVNRTASNQHELLVALCRRYLSAYGNGHIIIDGYSLPADFGADGGLIYDRKGALGVVSNDLAAARAVKVELDAEGHCGRVHLAVGLPVLNSLALGRLANFYVCHVGTVQHKVGWFHACPGVIHANSEVLSYDFGHIVAAQSEVAARVDQLPVRMVTDDAVSISEDDEVRRSLKYTGYSVHVAQAVDFVMRALDDAVSTRPNEVNMSATTTVTGLRAMHRHEVIQSFLDIFDQPKYLEIGVWAGETFHALRAGRKVAVDPTFRFEHSDREMGCEYHEVTSDQYFMALTHDASLFDVIFLDGMHTFEQTLRDLMNSIDFLRRDGVIVIDDVWPNSITPPSQTFEKPRPSRKRLAPPTSAGWATSINLFTSSKAFYRASTMPRVRTIMGS